MKFYRPGVGANLGGYKKWLDSILGKGVFATARQAWEDLCANYEEGDRIFIFGFSRGAFAARHLAGMIVRHGLKGWQGRIELGFREYLAEVDKPCQNVVTPVHFLGLFDCVPGNQLYLLNNRNTSLNHPVLEQGILHFRHEIAKLERRWSFRPLVFENGGQISFAQHWFPGYHSDVGGYTGNSVGIACFCLWWMAREAYGLGLGLDNIECPRHLGGSVMGITRAANPDAMPVPSDYWTTRLGLVWNRLERNKGPLIAETPNFYDLDVCPRCGHDLFDYFLTDVGQQFISKVKSNTSKSSD